jgi:hypothetical protein
MSHGSYKDNRAKAAEQGLTNVRLEKDHKIAEKYQEANYFSTCSFEMISSFWARSSSMSRIKTLTGFSLHGITDHLSRNIFLGG